MQDSWSNFFKLADRPARWSDPKPTRSSAPPPGAFWASAKPPHGLRRLAHDRQAQPRARAARARPRRGRSGRRRRAGPPREARPVVAHAQHAVRQRAPPQSALGGAPLARVVEQVRHRTRDPVGCSAHDRRLELAARSAARRAARALCTAPLAPARPACTSSAALVRASRPAPARRRRPPAPSARRAPRRCPRAGSPARPPAAAPLRRGSGCSRAARRSACAARGSRPRSADAAPLRSARARRASR